jgi:tetratricopeptide (TPR) repeat protein
MLRSEPDNASLHGDLKDYIRELSVAFRENGGLNESAKLYEWAEKLFAELAGVAEEREANLFRRAEVLKIAGERRADLGNLQSCAAHFQNGLDVMLDLYRADPKDPKRRYLLASAVANRAWAHEKVDDLEAALRDYQMAHALYAGVPENYRNRERHMAKDARTIHQLKIKLGLLGEQSSGEIVLAMGSEWRYLDAGKPASGGWNAGDFDASAWRSGRAQFGYGDDDEVTVIEFGDDPEHKHPTAYFRRTFEISELGSLRTIHFALVRDDGAAVYLNGKEIARTMLPEGPISFNTFATDFTANDVENEPEWFDFAAGDLPLRQGTNTVAVEIHQVEGASSDLSFDLEVQINATDVDPLEGMDRTALDSLLEVPPL